MSLEAFGDEGNAPANGKDTAIYQDFGPIYDKFADWRIKYKKDFSGPEEVKLASDIYEAMGQLCERLEAWKP